VVLTTQYCDAFYRVRLSTGRSPAAELIWSLLPPPTAGVDSFVIAGVVEPRHDVHGDAFDYSLSESTANLFILDAVGHDPRRDRPSHRTDAVHQRRSPLSLDHAIGQDRQTPHRGTPARPRARSCRVHDRRRNAGTRRLAGPLHDGIVEARDHNGEFFGEDRLIDFLRREAASGYPPPETARPRPGSFGGEREPIPDGRPGVINGGACQQARQEVRELLGGTDRLRVESS
jgi:hypothetical protein